MNEALAAHHAMEGAEGAYGIGSIEATAELATLSGQVAILQLKYNYIKGSRET